MFLGRLYAIHPVVLPTSPSSPVGQALGDSREILSFFLACYSIWHRTQWDAVRQAGLSAFETRLVRGKAVASGVDVALWRRMRETVSPFHEAPM